MHGRSSACSNAVLGRTDKNVECEQCERLAKRTITFLYFFPYVIVMTECPVFPRLSLVLLFYGLTLNLLNVNFQKHK